MSDVVQIRLKEKRDRPVRLGHPWIFSGAIDNWSGPREAGAVADVLDSTGEWLARGIAHPGSGLAVRIYSRNPSTPIHAALFRSRVDDALALREALFGPIRADAPTNAYRLVFSEADNLSGLIVDRYADRLSIRVSARGLVPFLPDMLEHLRNRTGIAAVYVAPETEAGEREGLTEADTAPLSKGPVFKTTVQEHGLLFEVDVQSGQKTGFYLDQRESRRRVAAYARGRSVLSCYCYTGAFEVHAAAAGAASVTGIDVSGEALDAARRHFALNKLEAPAEYVEADVPVALRRFRDARRSFDLIVLDPPRFVSSEAHKDKGMRAYKDINLLALKLLNPGGILATFSCSGLISPEDLKTVLRWASYDAGRQVQVLEMLGQPPDHPVLLAFPESEYLCGLIARV